MFIHFRKSSGRRMMLNGLIPSSVRARILLLDNATRWGSTFRMIERALELKVYYGKLCEKDVDLMPYQLQESDWRYLQELNGLLRHFNTLSIKLQGSSYATIPLTIAAYNALLDSLEDYIEQDDSHASRRQRRQPDLVRGAKAAKDKLLQYYRCTDDTPIYAVATAMHFAMRFDWWTREPQNWETEVVDEAKRTVAEIWSDQYKPDPHQATAEQTTTQDSIVNASVAELDFLGAPDPKAVSNTRHCELEEYVAARYARVLPLEFGRRVICTQHQAYPTLPKWPVTFLQFQQHQPHQNGLSPRDVLACPTLGTV